MKLTIQHHILLDGLFRNEPARLGRFIRYWMTAIELNDPSYVPLPEDDNEDTRMLANRHNWIVPGSNRQYFLTGPDRNVIWLLHDNHREVKTYFIESVDQGVVKIGKSKDVLRRLGELQSSSAHRLRLRAVVNGDIEDQLHVQFAAYRLKGEWFKFVDDIKAMVASFEEAESR